MAFDLSGFKPEPLADDDFAPFGGKYDVKVEESMISDVPAGERNGEAYEGYTRLKMKLVVCNAYKEEQAVNINRVLYRSYNIDNEDRVKKLAQLFWSLDLEFSNREELEKVNEKFVGQTLTVSCWVGKKDQNQAFKFVKASTEKPSAEAPF